MKHSFRQRDHAGGNARRGRCPCRAHRHGPDGDFREARRQGSQPAFARRAMTLMDAQRGIYAGPLPPLDSGHPGFKYYVIVIDSDFNEIASEVLLYGRAPGPAFPRRPQALPARNLVPRISRADLTRPVASIPSASPARPETSGVHDDGR